jgi:hypothetical protein
MTGPVSTRVEVAHSALVIRFIVEHLFGGFDLCDLL